MILRAEAICKKFRRESGGANFFYALRETDLTFAENALTMIKGRSGSGKTTLLNILGGLLAPSGGRVFLGDADLYAMPDKKLSKFRNRNIGVIPQGSTALGSLTVLENVLLPTLLYGRREEESAARAEALLNRVGISALQQAMPSELSGGELRRMAIARALMTRPAVLLADEPTGDLDDENTAAVLSLLRETACEGTTVIVVTHEPEAERYADRVLRMDAGVLKELS